tara:strand:+ start:73 stop:789 length:717 start_codon:yes stop_codon:yes gene_type:complete
MAKEYKIKLILAISYAVIVAVFLWAFFSHFSLNELTSYDFIKENRNYLNQFKTNNYLLSITLFFIFTIFWVLLLGFGTPIALLGGFVFGKWVGTLIVAIALSIGATFLYLFSKYFLKDIIEKKFYEKFKNLKEKFKKNEFIFFLIYRFVGGIPFFISNIIPTLFDVKVKNFLFGSILGMIPQLFVYVALGSGLENIINENTEAPSFFSIIFSKEIYLPIIAFIILIIIGIFIKKRFTK